MQRLLRFTKTNENFKTKIKGVHIIKISAKRIVEVPLQDSFVKKF